MNITLNQLKGNSYNREMGTTRRAKALAHLQNLLQQTTSNLRKRELREKIAIICKIENGGVFHLISKVSDINPELLEIDREWSKSDRPITYHEEKFGTNRINLA